VVWVAKRFRGRGFDFVDLIQEGNLGLIRAVDRFDPRVGARFSTFATHWIQQGIRRALAEKARTIRIPVNRIPEVRQILSAKTRLGAQLGRAARAPEIARGCGFDVAKVEELLKAIGTIQSIDAPIPSTEKLLSDTLADRGQPSPFDEALDVEMRRVVKEVLDELPERQRTILAMRHGIEYPKECTLDEIGDALGLSRERIRQVERTAETAVRDWIVRHRSELAKPV
jgi:RNA polymerase sigma factor (sigma-70 family)